MRWISGRASEHKIFYKYEREVPERLIADLRDAAKVAEQLDLRMQDLHREVHGEPDSGEDDPHIDLDENVIKQLWEAAQRQDATRQGDRCVTKNDDRDAAAQEDGA